VQAGARALAQDPGDRVGEPAPVGLGERRGEAVPAVQQHDDVRQPGLAGTGPGALLADVREPAVGQQLLPAETESLIDEILPSWRSSVA
jgi:hypothetical protein